jgi:replicative DNA helicase
MINDQTKVDAVTLADELQTRKQLDDLGGVPLLLDLMETVPHAAHAKHYAEIVRDKWILRNLTQTCTDVLAQCYRTGGETSEILANAERRVFEILEHQELDQKIDIGSVLLTALERINARMANPGGFTDVDRLTNGFGPSQLIVLAARPSMGKTAFVCNIAEWAAGYGTTTVLFSLEQSKLELAERFLCIHSRLNGHSVRKGILEPAERFELLKSADALKELPLFIDDKADRTISEISAICRRLKRRNNLGMVIIDYLQLIAPEDKRANREQQIAQITRRLKGIAKENNVPVIALSQLNRGVELREDKRPRLADLRESGAIEQDADLVMFLHRPDAYNAEDRPGEVEVIVAKHRSGPTDVVVLEWRKESMRFQDRCKSAVPASSDF